jgi:hypothetical protein
MSIPAGTRLGPYEILSALGAGGMGEVYRARDTRLGREVAVKVLPPSVSADSDRLRRFEKEAQSASSLNHPNVVTVFDIGESDGIAYMAMELVDGRTLRELLAEGALPPKRLLGIAAQLADGLARAHGAGIVHRDLKPENVMVRKDGFVKILDFGLAKLTQVDAGEADQSRSPTVTVATEAGVIMGTVGYMSPEQALGKTLDFRSDQFAVGSILYEMATGRRAFVRPSAPETLAAIIRDEPEPMAAAAPGTPTPLVWFTERCLAKDPEERYASTRDLARDLARLRDGLSQSSVSGGAAAEGPAKTRRRRLLTWAAAGLAVAAAIAAAATWRRVAEPPTFRALTFRRGAMGGARFVPEGQTVIYAASWQGNPMQLYTTRADSTDATTMQLPSADLLAVSSNGKMAIGLDRDGNHVVAEVSLAGGAPRDLFEGDARVDYSPSGDRMVVCRDGKLEFPPGKVLYDAGPDKQLISPRFSPDGRWIAFIEVAGVRGTIAVVDLEGKKRVLSDGWETTVSLAWNPQTGEVWFSAREFASFGVVDLHAVTLSGRHRVVARTPLLLLVQDIARDGRVLLRADDWTETTMALAPGAVKETDLTWLDDTGVADLSSDGQKVLLNEGGIGEGANSAVYLRKTDGSPAVRLGEGTAHALSPDGKWAITHKGNDLVLLPTGAGQPRVLATPGLVVNEPKWFPDGTKIFYDAGPAGKPTRVHVQDAAGGAPRAIGPENYFGRAISPDGRFIAARDVKRGGFLIPTEGGDPRPLPGGPLEGRILSFDTAGTGLYLGSFETPLKVTRRDIASGRSEPWRQIDVADPAGFMQYNDVVITPDGKSYAYTFWRALSRLYVVNGLK